MRSRIANIFNLPKFELHRTPLQNSPFFVIPISLVIVDKTEVVAIKRHVKRHCFIPVVQMGINRIGQC